MRLRSSSLLRNATGWAVCVLLLAIGALVGGPAAHAQSSQRALPEAPADSVLDDASAPEAARAAPTDQNLFYVVNEPAALFAAADSSTRRTRLSLRTPLHRTDCVDNWCRVRTDDGRAGYVDRSALSNVWIHVSKRERRVHLYRGTQRIESFKADFGYNMFSDKEQRGSRRDPDHWRTPEGRFFIVRKNPHSKFDRALVLNYPTAGDARRGLKTGLITQAQHDAIVRAQEQVRMPPMNTKLGGWLEIHGDGTGAATNWTQGCVALHNRDMQRLWWWVGVGTPVLIN